MQPLHPFCPAKGVKTPLLSAAAGQPRQLNSPQMSARNGSVPPLGADPLIAVEDFAVDGNPAADPAAEDHP